MINCAKQSPRVCGDNTIRWYEGDTFKLELNFKFTDTNGNTLPVEETDVVKMKIFDGKNEVIHEIEVTGTNVVPLDMTEKLTSLFTKGEYTYNAHLIGEYRTTLARNNKLVVE